MGQWNPGNVWWELPGLQRFKQKTLEVRTYSQSHEAKVQVKAKTIDRKKMIKKINDKNKKMPFLSFDVNGP